MLACVLTPLTLNIQILPLVYLNLTLVLNILMLIVLLWMFLFKSKFFVNVFHWVKGADKIRLLFFLLPFM